MHKKNKLKAIVAIVVALAFVMPVAAVANIDTIGVTSDSENTGDIENIVETSTNSDMSDAIEIAIDDEPIEDPVIDTEELSVVNDDTSAVLSTGNTIEVDDDADPSWYNATHVRTFHEGLANSTAGDTIYIHNGTYTETASYTTINKQLNIVGASRENVLLSGKSSYNKGFLYITSNNVNISNMTITNTGSYMVIYSKGYDYLNFKDLNVNQVKKTYEGLYIRDGSNINVINCEVYNTKDGMEIYQCSYVDVINCVVHDCKAYGIYIYMPVNPTSVIGCTVYNTYNSGISFKYYYSSVAPFLLQDCTVHTATSGYGIYIDSQIDGDVIGCTAYNNRYAGISLANSDYVDVVNCTSYNNTQEGIEMGTGYNYPENCNITDCTVYGNSVGIYLGAYAIILTGNTMYGNGCNLEIDVDPYQYTIDPTNTVSGKPVYYLVEVDNVTLDGEVSSFGYLGFIGCNNVTAKNAAPEGVVVAYTTNATLYNVTVSGATIGFYFYGGSYVTVEKCTASGNGDTGFYLYYTENVEFTECTVTNMLNSDADAFYVRGSPGVSLTDCLAHDIGLSYGFNIYECPNANLVNCNVHNAGPTYATGIALYYSPYSNIIDCTVDHSQRGFDARSSSTFVNFINCTAHHTTYCGFEARSADLNYVNCTVYNSEGFFNYNQPRCNYTNCKSYDSRYGIYLYYGTDCNFLNCDFYDNSVNGVDIHSASYGNTFTNCNIYNHTSVLDGYGNPVGYGVKIEDNSYGTILTDCNVYNNTRGVYIYDSPNNVLRDVTIDDNNHSFDVTGGSIADFYQDIDTSNTINGDPIYYLVDEENMTIGTTYYAGIGYLIMVLCNNITVQNMDIPTVGLKMIQTTNSTLLNVNVHDGKGVHLWESSDNDVTGCMIYNNAGHGLYLQDSSNNDVTSCTIYNNTGHGLYLLNSPDNTITGCTVYDNNYGIYLSASPDTTITGCTVYDNNYGIYISASADNILNSNSFSGNANGFGIAGAATADFFQDIDVSNLIDGVPIWYLVGESYDLIDETSVYSYLILVDCDHMTLQNLDVGDLLIILTTNSTLSNIEAHDGVDGIYLWGSSDNDIIECTVYNHTGNGIYLRDSSNNDVTDCTLYSNGNGIYLSGSSYNSIDGCDSYNNGNGFYLTGSSYNDFIQCTAYSNSNGFYLTGSTWNNIMICDMYSNSKGVYLKSTSNNNNIVLGELYDNSHGFYLDHVSGCVIDKCDMHDNNGYGIYGNYASSNYITESTICNDGSYGMYLKYSNSNYIQECDISHNSHGIYFYYSDSNHIENCDMYGNSNGMYLYYGCNNNVFWSNTIYNNAGYGIYFKKTSGTSGNRAYHNKFVSNAHHTYCYYTSNKWDNGYSDPYNASTDGGNYWDDYTGVDFFHGPSQNLTGPDGIGDTSYTLISRVTDRYPLMNMTDPIDTIPPVITDVTLTTSDPIDTEPGFGWEKVTATITDNHAVDMSTVKLNVTNPDHTTTVEYAMTHDPCCDTYECTVTLTQPGNYSYHLWAADLSLNNVTGAELLFSLPMNEDVTNNGQVYFEDLIAIVMMYGETGPGGWVREDVDNNGQVYFGDLIAVVMEYGVWWWT